MCTSYSSEENCIERNGECDWNNENTAELKVS
jgi:hypothetical protein